jgi:hypothetical protein
LLGSVFLFQYFIEPVSHILMTRWTLSTSSMSPKDESSITSMSVWSFYHLLWMVPIWGLCYAVSLGCYQSIANDVHHLQHQYKERQERDGEGHKRGHSHRQEERGGEEREAKAVDVKRSFSGSVYASLVWVFMILQLRFFDLLLPALLLHTARLAQSLLLLLLSSSSSSDQGGSVVTTVVMGLRLSSLNLHSLATLLLVQPLYLASLLCRCFGLLLGGVVHGWYGFDLCWIAGGVQPEERFRRVEQHWVYFLGFGLPPLLLLQCSSFSSSFFLTYSLYLMLFPLHVMLGAVCDYKQGGEEQRKGERKQGQGGEEVASFRVFRPAQRLALQTIKVLDKYLRPPSATRNKSKERNKN